MSPDWYPVTEAVKYSDKLTRRREHIHTTDKEQKKTNPL